MKYPTAFLSVLIVVPLCLGDISGIVTDTAGTTPISGVIVQLENGGQRDTTGADGTFTLGITTAIRWGNGGSIPNGICAKISNNTLSVTVAQKSAVEIDRFDLSGKLLSRIQQTMTAGTHSIPFPQMGAGVYLYRIRAGEEQFMLKCSSIGKAAQVTPQSVQGTLLNNTLAKATMIDDVIKTAKDGYLNSRIAVTNTDTSGIQIKLISQDAGSVTDIDGNVYSATRIGEQVWTAENLKTTKYNDGTPIMHAPDSVTWCNLWESNLDAGTYCYYDNDVANMANYGVLYNWHAVNTGKLAPEGWHVPSDAEWTELENYLSANGYSCDATITEGAISGAMADPRGGWYWNEYACNASGFSALPGGFRYRDGNFGPIIIEPRGDFVIGIWWSATEEGTQTAYFRQVYSGGHYGFVDKLRGFANKSEGFSVRLVRNSN